MIGGNARAYADDFCSYSGKPPVSLCDDEYHGTGALDRVCPAADGTWVWVAVRSDASSSGWSAPSACPSWPPTTASPGWRTGLRGQHDRAILAELGYGEDEVAELEAAGPVIPPA